MAKTLGALGLTYGVVFASFSVKSREEGLHEMAQIARIEMIPEYNVVFYTFDPLGKRTTHIHYVTNTKEQEIARKQVARDNLVQEFVKLTSKEGTSRIVAIEG